MQEVEELWDKVQELEKTVRDLKELVIFLKKEAIQCNKVRKKNTLILAREMVKKVVKIIRGSNKS